MVYITTGSKAAVGAVLMVMIDDATNRTYARFFEEETTRAAYDTLNGMRQRGLPQALYVDRQHLVGQKDSRAWPSNWPMQRPDAVWPRHERAWGGFATGLFPAGQRTGGRRNGLLQIDWSKKCVWLASVIWKRPTSF